MSLFVIALTMSLFVGEKFDLKKKNNVAAPLKGSLNLKSHRLFNAFYQIWKVSLKNSNNV